MSLPNILLMLIIVLTTTCSLRWVLTIRRGNMQGIGALAARVYLLILYLITWLAPPSIDTRIILLRIGLVAVLLDEVIYWLISLRMTKKAINEQ